MSASRLNIVSDIPANRELITDGVNGLTFRTGDASDLATKMQLALTDHDARLRLAAAGNIELDEILGPDGCRDRCRDVGFHRCQGGSLMMRREAHWLGERLKAFSNDEISPMLSVGSSLTRTFRRALIVDPKRSVRRSLSAASLFCITRSRHRKAWMWRATSANRLCFDRLLELEVRTVLCLNVFEHVTDRTALADSLVASLPPGGLLVVTVPKRYPYHADPIDTLFRPTSTELAALFTGVEVVDFRARPLRVSGQPLVVEAGQVGGGAQSGRRRRGGSPPASTAAIDLRPVRRSATFASMMAMLFVSLRKITYVILHQDCRVPMT